MFRKLARAMERNDLAQDFLLHKMPRPITSCAFVVREKIFDAVVIQRGHVVRVPVMRASLPVARREHNAPSLRPTQRLEPEQHRDADLNGGVDPIFHHLLACHDGVLDCGNFHPGPHHCSFEYFLGGQMFPIDILRDLPIMLDKLIWHQASQSPIAQARP